jgi:guanylate kinase
MKKLPIILLVGPSGSGKTTIAEILNLRNGWTQIESYTTRLSRFPGEKGHTFITDKEFDDLTDLVAYTEYNGNRYGCTAQQIDDNDIYVVDIPGVETLLKNYHGNKEMVAFFLDVHQDIRRIRMTQRGDWIYDVETRLVHDEDNFADAAAKLAYLLGADNVVAMSEMSSEEIATAIEEYLKQKGYEWETI